jgi:fermentation-respiration switch protein FrsA (DUF1100 family)
MIDGKPIHPPLCVRYTAVSYLVDSICSEFVIPISGFVPSDPLLERIISRTSPKLTTPSLHVVGDNDMIVPRERSQFLISAYEEKAARVERHEGGSWGIQNVHYMSIDLCLGQGTLYLLQPTGEISSRNTS